MYDSDVFTVTPTSQKIKLVAGETYTGTIMVANPANATQDFNFIVSVAPYNVTGEDYGADLKTTSSRTNIVNWIKISDPKGTLKPNEVKKVNFTITVPEDAAGGGQYAALLVGSDMDKAAEDGLTIQNIYEIASVIYGDVAGDTVHDGEIVDNYVPGFSFNLPVTASATLRNDGNIHETARIGLKIKNVITAETVYPQNGENGAIEEVIMPETTRYTTRDINSISPLGIYEVTQTITYLGESSTFRQTLIVCPLWFLLLVIMTVGAVFASIIRLVVKHRKNKKTF